MNWRRFFRRGEADAEQRQELEFYLDLTTEEYIERGMEPAAARAAARRKLGNATLIREEVYRVNTLTFLEGVLRDARHALRMIRTKPGFSAAVLLSLALGIGANTAIFSVLNAVLIRPLPYPGSDALVGVFNSLTIQGQVFADADLSPGMYAACKEGARVFERFGVWTSGAATVTGTGEPEQVVTVTATQGVLPALGVPAHVGRWFSEEDDTPGSPETVILSYGYWQRRFGGTGEVLGRTMIVDFIPRQVIGVMPRDFRFVDLSPDILLPQRFPKSGRPDEFSYTGIARLKPGVTIALANQDVARVWKAWGESRGTAKMLDMLHVKPNLRPLKQRRRGRCGLRARSADGRARAGAAAGVRQRGEPGAGARAIAEAGVCDSRGAGRRMGKDCARTAGGEPGAGPPGRRTRPGRSHGWDFGCWSRWGPPVFPGSRRSRWTEPALAFALACSLGSSLLFGLAAVLTVRHSRPDRKRARRDARRANNSAPKMRWWSRRWRWRLCCWWPAG